MMSSTDLTVLSRGEHLMAPLSQTAKFTDPITRHHRPFYDDYSIAKDHIAQAIGSIDDMDLFGRQVLCAVFCRPNTMKIKKSDGTETTIYLPVKEIKEDWWQHKASLILKVGPDAFQGDESWHNAVYGEGVPAPTVGDWVFCNANAGMQMNICGEGASRPQGVDHRDATFDLFEWDGWPCRIIGDDNFLGRVTKPHSIV